MKKLKAFTLALIAAAMCLLASCGSSQGGAPSVHYEKVLDTLTSAVSLNDTEAYLLCFTEAARLNYMNSESYDRELAGKLSVKDEGRSLALICTVNEHRELTESEIASLEEAYKEKYSLRIDITKAYELSTVFTSGNKMAERTVYTVNNGNDWYILGPVIERFFENTNEASSAD